MLIENGYVSKSVILYLINNFLFNYLSISDKSILLNEWSSHHAL